ncbi:MAG: tRNA (adenosine(37)-N6)-dimethylallyltransferase MiaA [Melioribacteraceae bacterium]|nr:tRNA (adenosine(37)-N6)-dimethylallyltransferase MiaA [Melioribacteraceae bacterium]
MEKLALVIIGPTCSGKTSLALNLAKKLNSEIISADSRQIYKYLDIGTAKPTLEELNSIKHHFIDILDPSAEFNASMFEIEALKIITELHSQNKIPIIAGGSGLYVKALIDGIFDSIDSDEDYRIELLELKNKFGNEYLFEELKKIDPVSAEKMLPQNWKRVIRALEVYKISGEPIWKLQSSHQREVNVNFIQYGLNWEREILYKNIETRVDKMIEDGLIDEVSNLINKYDKSLNSLNTVGYKEIIEFLENKISKERTVELIKRNTRRYAKRQLTWFRKDEHIKWIDISSLSEIEQVSSEIIKQITK